MTDMRIAALRRERGWTQEHLASVSGVGVRTVQRLEAGEDGSLETLRRVAAALEVAVAEVFAPSAPDEGAVTASPRRAVTRRGGRTFVLRPIVLFAVIGIVTGAVAGAVRPLEFESSARAVVAASDPSGFPYGPRSEFIREVGQSYASLVSTPLVLTRAGTRLGPDGSDLREAVSARVDPQTGLLVVTGRGDSASMAAHRAEAVLQTVVDLVPTLTPQGATGPRITPVGETSTSTDPTWFVGIAAGGGIGLGGGLLLGLAIALVRRRPLDPPGAVGRLAIP